MGTSHLETGAPNLGSVITGLYAVARAYNDAGCRWAVYAGSGHGHAQTG